MSATDTRVLEYVNEYGIEDYYCDGYLGQFVNDATVQVLSITTEKEPPNSVYCTVGGAPSNEVGQTFTQREVLSLGKTLAAL